MAILLNLKRNKAFQALGKFFFQSEMRGSMDGMSIAEVREKIREFSQDAVDATNEQAAELGIKEPKVTRMSVPDKGTQHKETPRLIELAQATSATAAAKLEIQRLEARVKALEARPAAPAKPAEPTTAALSKIAEAAFGESFVNHISKETHTEAEFRERVCRAIHLSALTVPNLDLSAHEKRFGKIEPTGLQRVERGQRQERINNCLQRLK